MLPVGTGARLRRVFTRGMDQKEKTLRPTNWVYNAAITLFGFCWWLLFGARYGRKDINGIHGPFIAVCNHPSNLDGFTAMLALRAYKVNVVVAEFYFRYRVLRWFFGKIGAIPKSQFTNDIKAIQSMLRVIRDGGNLLIFPGGQSSFAGIGTYIHPGIAKLVKKLGVPVVDLHIEGSYFTFPKWCSFIRPGKVSVTTRILYTPEQLAQLTPAEIEQGIKDAVAYDEYAVQQRAKVRFFAAKSARGLHTILYKCPNCGNEFSIRSKGSRLWCAHCGGTVHLNRYGLFDRERNDSIRFSSPADWYRWQLETLKKQALLEGFELRTQTRIWVFNRLHGGYRFLGRGEAVLNREGFSFKGLHHKSGEAFTLSVHSKNLLAIPALPGHHIKICHPDGMYMLKPENGLHSIKWVLTQDILTGTY